MIHEQSIICECIFISSLSHLIGISIQRLIYLSLSWIQAIIWEWIHMSHLTMIHERSIISACIFTSSLSHLISILIQRLICIMLKWIQVIIWEWIQVRHQTMIHEWSIIWSIICIFYWKLISGIFSDYQWYQWKWFFHDNFIVYSLLTNYLYLWWFSVCNWWMVSDGKWFSHTILFVYSFTPSVFDVWSSSLVLNVLLGDFPFAIDGWYQMVNESHIIFCLYIHIPEQRWSLLWSYHEVITNHSVNLQVKRW